VGTVQQLASLVLLYGKLFALVVLFKMHAWKAFAAYTALVAAAFLVMGPLAFLWSCSRPLFWCVCVFFFFFWIKTPPLLC
jgi:hypothetical protein